MRKPKTGTSSGPHSPLMQRLRRRLQEERPLPFSEFMLAALYDPEHGYYTSGTSPWGPAGDYVTAPQVHPALGRAVARLAHEVDRDLGRPDPFVLIEGGSGDGRLLASVASTLCSESRGLWDRLRVFSVERGAGAARQPAPGCPRPPRGLDVVPDLSSISGAGAGMLYSNELFDAFPVERVRLHEGRLQRSYVEASSGGLRERFADRDVVDIGEHLSRCGVHLREGQVAEVCLVAERWLEQASRCLSAGAWLTIDYGHETVELYGASRPAGTLIAHRDFALSDDLLAFPGQQDLTAHVDFGSLRRCGRRLGWEDRELCSLRVFLLGMGAAADPSGSAVERLALRHLLVSEIGDAHRVLLQARGLPAGRPRFGRQRLEPSDANTGEAG